MVAINDFDSFIKEEQIINIDVRYTNDIGLWQGITIPARSFSKELLKKGLYIGHNLVQISLKRSFIDPFVAHKTLVFLTDFNSQFLLSNNNADDLIVEYLLKFAFKDNQNNSTVFMDFKSDKFKDIRNEISQMLNQIGVHVKYNAYENNSDEQSFVVISKGNPIFHLDDIQKVKYTIMMVSNAYNLEIKHYDGDIFSQYKFCYSKLKLY